MCAHLPADATQFHEWKLALRSWLWSSPTTPTISALCITTLSTLPRLRLDNEVSVSRLLPTLRPIFRSFSNPRLDYFSSYRILSLMLTSTCSHRECHCILGITSACRIERPSTSTCRFKDWRGRGKHLLYSSHANFLLTRRFIRWYTHQVVSLGGS